jgi:DNA-directed RNA polymerase subunit M/transcription elongation factor TFIIS
MQSVMPLISCPNCGSRKFSKDDDELYCFRCGHTAYLDKNGYPVCFKPRYVRHGSHYEVRLERDTQRTRQPKRTEQKEKADQPLLFSVTNRKINVV